MQSKRVVHALHATLANALVALLFLASAWAGSTDTLLYSFAGGTNDGMYPAAALVLSKSGHLYGTTSQGGNSTVCGIFGGSCGVVFELTPVSGGGWKETVLYEFTGGADGGTPYAPLVTDSDGNLYGTANVGGASGMGTAFEMTRGSGGTWTETVLHSFAGGSDGAYPRAGLTLKGNSLYGTTLQGGTGTNCGYFGGGSCGTVFKLTHSKTGWKEKVLYSFTGYGDGGYPYGGVVFDKKGDLYGTTFQNGSTGYGTVFELIHGKGTWTESTLYTFTGGADGKASYGGVIFDAKGNLYGTTSQAGSDGGGTIFELTPGTSGWTLTVLHGFTGAPDGNYPEAGVVKRGDSLYGTTYDGGTGSACGPFGGQPCGTVFEVSYTEGSGWTETVLYSFAGGTDGASPEDSVIFDKAGNLFGTTFGGGIGDGVVFEIP
jgi:uncharacterized repeat protein (TIGR03803 family)